MTKAAWVLVSHTRNSKWMGQVSEARFIYVRNFLPQQPGGVSKKERLVEETEKLVCEQGRQWSKWGLLSTVEGKSRAVAHNQSEGQNPELELPFCPACSG